MQHTCTYLIQMSGWKYSLCLSTECIAHHGNQYQNKVENYVNHVSSLIGWLHGTTPTQYLNIGVYKKMQLINPDYASAAIDKHQRCMASVYINNQVYKQTQLYHTSIQQYMYLYPLHQSGYIHSHRSAYTYIRIFINLVINL